MAVLVCSLLGAQGIARTLDAPPFIRDRALGSSLADDLQSIASSGARPAEINRSGRELLAKAYSAQGRRFQSNFPRGFDVDLSISDHRKIATNLLKGNLKNWHGYERELKYLNVLSRQDSPFSITSVGSRARIADGRFVEFDLLLKDKHSGMTMSMEVKDWQIDTRAKLDKAKEQIAKIARRASEQGVDRSIWVNRSGIGAGFREELENHAKRHRVGFYQSVSTSEKLAHNLKKPVRLDDVLKKESQGLRRLKLGRIAGRGVGWVSVAYGVYEAGHGVYQWKQGGITTRQAVMSVSEGVGAAAGGVAGSWAGAETGAVVGTFIGGPPGTAIGTVIGGIFGGIGGAIAGAWSGGLAGSFAVDQIIFRGLDEKENKALTEFLSQHYSARR